MPGPILSRAWRQDKTCMELLNWAAANRVPTSSISILSITRTKPAKSWVPEALYLLEEVPHLDDFIALKGILEKKGYPSWFLIEGRTLTPDALRVLPQILETIESIKRIKNMVKWLNDKGKHLI